MAFIENSPTLVGSLISRVWARLKSAVLGLRVVQAILNLARRLLRVYFMFINFRRLLVVYLLADVFYYRWSDLGIDRDLRM